MQKINSRASTLDLLLTRRSVVAANIISPGPSDEQLQQIIAAGIRVPDHGKICPWRIQVIGATGREQLVELQTRVFNRERTEDSPKKLELLNKITLNSPRLLIVTSKPNMDKLGKVPLLEQQLSGGAVCQNILIAAHAMGYVAQWLTNWPAYHPEIKALLGHAEDSDILGFIHIGSVSAQPMDRDRPDYQTVVSHWG